MTTAQHDDKSRREQKSDPRRISLGLIAKISFSIIVILYLILTRVNLDELARALVNTDLSWFLASLALHPLGLFISSLRWQILLRAQNVNVPLHKLYASYLVCGFFNQFLPTRVGGDVVRAYDTALMGSSGVKSMAVVFVERMSGIVMLLIFGAVVALFRIMQSSTEQVYWVALAVGVAGLLAISALMLTWPVRLARNIFAKAGFSKIGTMLSSFHQIVLEYREAEKIRAFFIAFFLAFLLQLNVIVHYYLLGQALHFAQLSIIDYFVIVPMVQVVLMAPFAINGIGLREGAWIYFFAPFHIVAVHSFAYSLLDFAMYLFFGLLGGLIYAFRPGS